MVERSRPALTVPAALARGDGLEYVADPESLLPGHRLRPLVDGEETYPEMLRAIESARSYVHLESYIYANDSIGRTFAEALEARARAGVDVCLLVDGFGSFGLPDTFFLRLERAGVRCAVYGRLSRWRWRKWLRRDHRKILVIDGYIGFVGGINVTADQAPRAWGGKGWRDTHLRVEGPAVADLEAMFRESWLDARGEAYPRRPRDAVESVAVPESELAVALASDDGGRRSIIRRHYLHAIRAAREVVYLSCAYFVPDRGVRRELVRAAKRGVRVEILVPARSDVRSVQFAGERLYGRLLAGGVRIHQWVEGHMHAKTAVVDGVWSSIGSYNLDYVSLFQNMEVTLEVVGRRTGERLTRMFEADRERASEIDLEVWRRRPGWRRGLEWLAYRFRRWL